MVFNKGKNTNFKICILSKVTEYGKEDVEKENRSILCGSSLFSLVGDSDLHLRKRCELALDLITAHLLRVSEFIKQKRSEGGKEPIINVLSVVLSLV